MDFVKKNIILLLFLVICPIVLIYQTARILNAQEERRAAVEARSKRLEDMKKVVAAHILLDDTGQEKAEQVVAQSRQSYLNFANALAEKWLLPGVDFTTEEVTDTDMELKMFQLKIREAEAAAKEGAQDTATEGDAEAAAADAEGEKEKAATTEEKPASPLTPEEMARYEVVKKYPELPIRKRFDDWVSATHQDAREILRAQIRGLEDRIFRDEEIVQDQTTGGAPAPEHMDEEEAARMLANQDKIGRSSYLTQDFMFGEYLNNRPNGLLSHKEQRGVFRQFLMFELMLEMLKKAKIDRLENFVFPTGYELVEGVNGRALITPMTITLTAKPECAETFMNLLNADERYVFYIRDITDLHANIPLNSDPMLGLPPDLLGKLNQAMQGDVGVGTGGGDTSMGGRNYEGRTGERPRRRRSRRNAEAMPDTMGDRTGAAAEESSEGRIRKAFRFFALPARGEEESEAPLADSATTVTLTLNIEFAEFRRVTE